LLDALGDEREVAVLVVEATRATPESDEPPQADSGSAIAAAAITTTGH
jgi:hypothetical protein